MANTLTNLYQEIMLALDTVSRELVGFIPAVNRDSGVERAAIGQTVRSHVVPEQTATNIVPGVTAPNTGDQTVGSIELGITKARAVPVRWTGEETRGLQNSGNYSAIMRDRFEQAFRTLANEVEADLAGLYVGASRAYGLAGTAPFGTANDLSDVAQVRKILEDNGAPTSDLQLVLGTAATANMRGKQSVLFKVNEAGTEELLRRGIIGMLEGFQVHASGQIKTHVKGTGTGYLIDQALHEGVGQTTLTLDTGNGTIVPGDILTHASDAVNKYVVTTALAANDVVIAEPGLLIQADDDDAVTVGNAYAANMAFHRGAIVLATRLPALPEGGDMADDRETFTDPVSGLSFEVAIYRQYRQVHYEVALAWGQKLVKPEHVAILLG